MLKDRWEQRFSELLQFKDKHGHCLVPVDYPENRLLECWAKTQRMYHNKYLRKQSRERAATRASAHAHNHHHHSRLLLPGGVVELRNSTAPQLDRNASKEERRREYLRRYKAVYYKRKVKKASENSTDSSSNIADAVSNATVVESREETTAPAKIRIVARRKKREGRGEDEIWRLRLERFERLRAVGFFFDRREVCLCMYMCFYAGL
jgi:hypothetical protein